MTPPSLLYCAPAAALLPKSVVVVASGPSLCDDDIAYLRGRSAVIVVNSTYQRVPWADYLYAGDARWWYTHIDAVRACFAGQCWTIAAHCAQHLGLNRLRYGGLGPGLCPKPGYVYHGGNSGYQAIGLGHQLDYRRIILLGFDCQMTDGKKHHHDDHPGCLNGALDFRLWLRLFDTLPASAEALGIELINCTRQTAITTIPRANLCDVL